MTTTAHGRGRYTRGCRCAVCRRANREYARKRRATKLRAVPELAAQPEQPASGVVVAAVQAQIDRLGAAESRPGLAAIAVCLAELLDNPHAVPQHPAAAGRLVELLGKLAQDQRRGGRLAAVRDMTDRRGG